MPGDHLDGQAEQRGGLPDQPGRVHVDLGVPVRREAHWTAVQRRVQHRGRHRVVRPAPVGALLVAIEHAVHVRAERRQVLLHAESGVDVEDLVAVPHRVLGFARDVLDRLDTQADHVDVGLDAPLRRPGRRRRLRLHRV